MTGYRLTFSTTHNASASMVDTAVAADAVLGGVLSFITEQGEVLGQKSLLSRYVAQHIILFEAPSDEAAHAVALAALSWAHHQHPVDGEKLERRMRRYQSI